MTEKVFVFEGEDIPKDRLPIPVGWRLLIGMFEIETKTSGGIELPDQYRKGREYLRNIGKVLAVGCECYQHPKFQGNIPVEVKDPVPWVKVGDVVNVNAYTGQTIVVEDDNGNPKTLKLLNDDEILAVIPDLNVLSLK